MNWQTAVGGLIVLAFYSFSFWRIFKSNRGNRVIECGILALMCMLVLVTAMKIREVPEWALGGIGLLLFILCLLTMGFLFQQGYRAIRLRLAKSD